MFKWNFPTIIQIGYQGCEHKWVLNSVISNVLKLSQWNELWASFLRKWCIKYASIIRIYMSQYLIIQDKLSVSKWEKIQPWYEIVIGEKHIAHFLLRSTCIKCRKLMTNCISWNLWLSISFRLNKQKRSLAYENFWLDKFMFNAREWERKD